MPTDTTPVLRTRKRRFGVEPIREHFARGLWAVPAGTTLGAGLLAWAVITIDHHLGAASQSSVAFSGGASSAQQVLSTIATAVLTFTGLVFSIMIVALQLASSQFSPRVMRTFMRDRGTQVTLGIFVGTFVYTLVVLQSVRNGIGVKEPFVPGDAVTLAIIFVLVTVLAFVYIVHHMAASIRVTAIIESVSRETQDTIDAQFAPAVALDEVTSLPASRGDDLRSEALTEWGPEPTSTLGAVRAGVLTEYNVDGLSRLAQDHNVCIEILHAVGDFVPEGFPVARVHGTPHEGFASTLARRVGIAPERTMRQDVAFGFRQLVDIAERALSPAMNDPTTAVQALDRIHDLLRRLAARPFPTGIVRDESGTLRVVIPRESWREFVTLAFAEIRGYGETSLQIARRLGAALDDLIAYASPERQVALSEMRGELRHSIKRGFVDPGDRARAAVPDAGGIGSDDAED